MIPRRAFFIVAAIAALGGPAAGQTPAPLPSYPFQDMRDELLKGTQATARQLKTVDSIAAAYLDRMRALDPVLRTKTKQEIGKKLTELRVEQAKDIRMIITDAQRPVFDKNYAAWAKRYGLATSASGGPPSLR